MSFSQAPTKSPDVDHIAADDKQLYVRVYSKKDFIDGLKNDSGDEDEAPVSVSGSDKAPDSDKVPDSGSEHNLAAAAAAAATVDGSKPNVDQRPLELTTTISSNDDAGYDSDNYPSLQRAPLCYGDGTYYVGGDS